MVKYFRFIRRFDIPIYLGHVTGYCAKEDSAMDGDKRQETWETIRKAEKLGGQYMYCCILCCAITALEVAHFVECEPNFGDLGTGIGV